MQTRRSYTYITSLLGFPGGSDCKESAYNAGDLGSIPGLGRVLGGEHGNPRQYSCLEIPMDRGAWWAAVHRVAKSRTRLSDFSFSFATFLHWRRKWQPTSVFLPGNPHGQRSLVGYSPWGCKESDTSEQLNHHHQCANMPGS